MSREVDTLVLLASIMIADGQSSYCIGKYKFRQNQAFKAWVKASSTLLNEFHDILDEHPHMDAVVSDGHAFLNLVREELNKSQIKPIKNETT